MQDSVRETLAELIRKYGTSLVDDPRKLEGLLRDLCGEHQLEINALIGALKQKVATDLLNSTGVPYATLAARIVKRLEDNLGLRNDLARWAVESWAAALGVELTVAPILTPKPAPESPVKDEEIKQPIPSPGRPTPKYVPNDKQRNTMLFLKSALAVAVVCIIALLIVLAQPRHQESDSDLPQVVISKQPEGISISSLFLDLVGVPGAARFPTGDDDSGSCTTVNYPYYMGKTEVTYGQWKKVYDWAVDHGYAFGNPGQPGTYDSEHSDHPITNVSWWDCIVWCNALTEYSNAVEGTNYSCVYRYNGIVVRDAKNATAGDNVKADSGSKGFRLPTSMEWELAARYIDGKRWTPGNYASGRNNRIKNHTTSDVAWYEKNSDRSSHPVGMKASNALGIYDMSGNAWEWCFDWLEYNEWREIRGGSWNYGYFLQVGLTYGYSPSGSYNYLGFRLVRTL